MQVARARRALPLTAAIASAWLLVAGVLELRHEAEVAHAIDGSGVAVHGSHAIGHHDGVAAHFHARSGGHGADGECWLLIALHQPGASTATIAIAAAPISHHVVLAPAAIRVRPATTALFRLAPKTSPPVV